MNIEMTNGDYDIIGDIHGHASQLKKLLITMGYQLNNEGYYSHPNRTAIFLGDLIDGGSEQRQVINIVRPMIENGSAIAVMGNHEFNAIAYHSRHPLTKQALRSHGGNHQRQHQAFLNEYTDAEEIQELISWFKTLPVFLELDEIRLIHACWHQQLIDSIKFYLDENNCFDDDFLVEANQKGTLAYEAIEVLLKGIEQDLPEGISFKDNYGKIRNTIRLKWWQHQGESYKDYAIVPQKVEDQVPNVKIDLSDLGDFRYKSDQKPVFFGHYWFIGSPKRQLANVACLDYSVARNGKLTAYRWNKGDKEISNDSYIQ